jgi:threonine aldolase
MVDRLADDHARARRLADAVAARFPDAVDPERVETNIVCAQKAGLPDGIVERLEDRGVRAGLIDAQTVRFVIHKDVDDDGLERAIGALDELARAA